MNRKQLKQAFIEAMGETDYLSAYGKYMNTLLKDLPFNAREYYWNYIFYSYKHSDREKTFEIYGYKDLRA